MKKRGNPVPAFGFFERDKRLAAAKQARITAVVRCRTAGAATAHGHSQDDGLVRSVGSAERGMDGEEEGQVETLTDWEQLLLQTSWKQIKRLKDSESDLVRVALRGVSMCVRVRACLADLPGWQLVAPNDSAVARRFPALDWSPHTVQAAHFRRLEREDKEQWVRECPTAAGAFVVRVVRRRLFFVCCRQRHVVFMSYV